MKKFCSMKLVEAAALVLALLILLPSASALATGSGENASPAATLTAAELECVKSSLTVPVVVGVVDNCAPISYWNDEKGSYDGISVELLNMVSERTGLKLEYVSVDLTRRSEATHPNESSPKLVLGVPTVEGVADDRGWLISDGLIADDLVLVGRLGTDLSDGRSQKTIAIMENFELARKYVEANLPGFEIVEYPTLSGCLTAVASGAADASVYLKSCINYLLQKPLYSSLELIPVYSAAMEMHVAGFTPESETYLSIINKGLATISDEEKTAVTLNFTMLNPYPLTLGDAVYKYRAAIIVIAVLALGVIALLVCLMIVKRKSTKKLEEAYNQEKAALVLAEQASAAKGSFMSRMSHEIRTPLNAVIGYNTIARNELTEAKDEAGQRQAQMKVMDCLTKSDIASRHLLTIINDILDMSAIESGKILIIKERFDFKGLISSLTTIFYNQACAKDIEFEVLIDTLTEEWFVGDQLRVNQILANLLSNAVKFTTGGGRITLKICQPEAETNAAHIHFEIADTGIGMTKEYLDHIWTPFEQADPSISRRFGGTGLGLSITKNLVDLMGGSISVKSEPGKGTSFFVDLTFDRTEQPKSSATYDFSGINALIVDDDVSTCDYIKLLFGRFGARCAAVTSGAAALEAFTAAKERNELYTICLVDWRMPKMDGIETVRRIRNIVGNDIPIIVITAYDFSEVAEKAAEVGVNMFISKPLFQSSLFNLLANVCGKQTETTPQSSVKYDFSGSRLLLVEDNAMNMEVSKKILESTGLEIDMAWNGQDAVEMFTSCPPGTYKVILMDVQMPVMDGHTASRAIRAFDREDAGTIPIIAMTADAFTEDIAEAHAAGMNDHIAKPINIQKLFETISKYIG